MAELRVVGEMAGDRPGDPPAEPEVEKQPRKYSWRAPRWLPAALAIGAIFWAAGMWWMVANLGGSDTPPVEAQSVSDELAVLRAKVDSLTAQAASLGQEREALAKRVDILEARPAAAAPPPPSTTSASAAPPAIVPIDLSSTTAAYVIPRFGYRNIATPAATAAPAAQVTPAPVFAAALPPNAAASTGVPRFFTNGADRYNCTSFGSQADAQEALAANAPGDPNRLDMNANGIACEDIAYPTNTAKDLTPIPNR